MDKEVEEFFYKIKFPFTIGYGMTECGPLISYAPWDEFVLGSSGKILDIMEARIYKETPEAETGEIQVRGENVMVGYYKNQEATQEVFTQDGWLRTGDLGSMDSNGNIFIRGRLKTMILSSSGQNIFPEELETKLNNLPFILESLVIERNKKLVALVYADYEALDSLGLNNPNNLKTIIPLRHDVEFHTSVPVLLHRHFFLSEPDQAHWMPSLHLRKTFHKNHRDDRI